MFGNRMRWMGALLLAGGAVVAPGANARERPADSPPNLLLFLADDATFSDFGCYGSPDVQTPHIDRLAGEGMRFEYCFNSSPMCAPTRMSLYTGIHPVRNGAWPNHSRTYDHIRSLPHHLGALGYRVAIIGKRHEAPAEAFPFEYLGGRHHDGGKGVDLDLDRVGRFMEQHRDQPWCLIVASNQPHEPWNRGDANAYAPDSLTVPPYLVDTPETRTALARYYAEITYMDAQLGTCLEHLRATEQAGETLVMFLSEQGASLPFGKWTCYETGLRSAAVVRWPGVVAAGAKSEALVQYVDVAPTLVEIAGGDPAAEEYDFDGRSFLEVLSGEAADHHRYVFGLQTCSETYHGPKHPYGIRTVRDARYRLVWNLHWQSPFAPTWTGRRLLFRSWREAADRGDAHAQRRVLDYERRPEFELYDTHADPWGLDNLAQDPAYQDELTRLRSELDGWMQQQGDRGAETEEATPERLAER